MKKLLIILLCIPALGFSPSYVNFNTGQVTPLMEARVDFQKYTSSCRTMENMLVKIHGSAERRPGTYYVADTKTEAVARLIPFEISTDKSFVIEATNGFFRFYKDDGT